MNNTATTTQSEGHVLMPPVVQFLQSSPKKLLIGGKWMPARSGKTFETVNPANEEVLALVAEGDKVDVDEAVKAARKAFEDGRWARMGPHERTRHLLKIADLIDRHADELAQLETLDNGKPLSQARTIDIPKAAETFRYYAGWCTKIYGEKSIRPFDVQLHPARARGGLRPDNTVEFSAAYGSLEDCAGSCVRQYRHSEAC